jgi:ubiquinone/menaquinone biosynthesis C-methylase UbiE
VSKPTPYDEHYEHFRRTREKFTRRRLHPRSALYALADFGYPLRARPGRSLLELGSQFGDAAHFVSLSGAHVVGVDRNLVALSEGRSVWRRAQLPVQADLASVVAGLPFRDAAFDGVFSRDVLEHLPDVDCVRALFAELRRVTSPRATMVHIVTVREDGPNLDADPTHHIKQDRSWWRDFFTQQGFDVATNTVARAYGDNGQGWKRLVRHEGRFVLRPRST